MIKKLVSKAAAAANAQQLPHPTWSGTFVTKFLERKSNLLSDAEH